jgi:ADAM cysteine-rich domain
MNKVNPILPRFPADVQCRLRYGPSSRHAAVQRERDICRDLHCRREHFTWTSHPALEVSLLFKITVLPIGHISGT